MPFIDPFIDPFGAFWSSRYLEVISLDIGGMVAGAKYRGAPT